MARRTVPGPAHGAATRGAVYGLRPRWSGFSPAAKPTGAARTSGPACRRRSGARLAHRASGPACRFLPESARGVPSPGGECSTSFAPAAPGAAPPGARRRAGLSVGARGSPPFESRGDGVVAIGERRANPGDDQGRDFRPLAALVGVFPGGEADGGGSGLWPGLSISGRRACRALGPWPGLSVFSPEGG